MSETKDPNKMALNTMEMVRRAVDLQARDIGLWYIPKRISEAYLQKSLRDLHRVIESGDLEALKRIQERVEDQ